MFKKDYASKFIFSLLTTTGILNVATAAEVTSLVCLVQKEQNQYVSLSLRPDGEYDYEYSRTSQFLNINFKGSGHCQFHPMSPFSFSCSGKSSDNNLKLVSSEFTAQWFDPESNPRTTIELSMGASLTDTNGKFINSDATEKRIPKENCVLTTK